MKMMNSFRYLTALILLCPGMTRAQVTNFLFSGERVQHTVEPGVYLITAYGAKGGFSTILNHDGGLGAEMGAVFQFPSATTLTLVVGGAGHDGPGSPRGPGGGGGGTYVVDGKTPLVVAGGGGGGGYDNTAGTGGPGLVTNGGGAGLGGPGYSGAGGGGFTTDGGPGFWGSGQGYSFLNGSGSAGGGFYGASGGGFGGGGGGGNYQGGGGGGYTGGHGGAGNSAGGGGGSYIAPTAMAIRSMRSGVASPDGSKNGMVIIEAVAPVSIQQQPTSQVVALGSPVSFSVMATGLASLEYQWQRGGTNLPAATNSTLLLPSVTLSDVGIYRVLVSTPQISVVSSNASLAILGIAKVPVLVLDGPPGSSYRIESATNLSDTTAWTSITNITLSSEQPFVHYVSYGYYRTNPPTFYRAVPRPGEGP